MCLGCFVYSRKQYGGSVTEAERIMYRWRRESDRMLLEWRVVDDYMRKHPGCTLERRGAGVYVGISDQRRCDILREYYAREEQRWLVYVRYAAVCRVVLCLATAL